MLSKGNKQAYVFMNSVGCGRDGVTVTVTRKLLIKKSNSVELLFADADGLFSREYFLKLSAQYK